MDVVIYGVMEEPKRTEVEYLLSKDCNLIAYTDYDYDFRYFANRPFVRSDRLADELNFDYVIIALRDRDLCRRIKDRLIADDVPADKIVIPYFYTFTTRRMNYDLLKNFIRSPLSFDGLIMGNSYALRGIKTEHLQGCWHNMGWHGLDIYYCYKLLERLIKGADCAFKMHEVKRIMLVAPYYFVNYDMSLSQYQLDTGQCWAVYNLDAPHHFPELPCYKDYRQAYEINKRLFAKNVNSFSLSPWQGEVVTAHIDEEQKKAVANRQLSHVWSKEHTKTLRENREYFSQILKLVNRQGVKFTLIVPPFHRVIRDFHTEEIEGIKRLFYDAVEDAGLDLNDLYDFFDDDSISQNDVYWADEEHLNDKGAVAFTKKVADTLGGGKDYVHY